MGAASVLAGIEHQHAIIPVGAGIDTVSLIFCSAGHGAACRMELPSSQDAGSTVSVKMIFKDFLDDARFHSIAGPSLGSPWLFP